MNTSVWQAYSYKIFIILLNVHMHDSFEFISHATNIFNSIELNTHMHDYNNETATCSAVSMQLVCNKVEIESQLY